MILEILRRTDAVSEPYWQKIAMEIQDTDMTVASALLQINTTIPVVDIDGNPVSPIAWECSCLQKKCGACAMLINGKPSLACDARLSEIQKNEHIKLEPLRKFPVIADLIVDRHILYENLKTMKIWLHEHTIAEDTQALAYEASQCLQCGCCLEICPNFCGHDFFGMAAFVPTARLLSELSASQAKELYADYEKHIYAGCGKSLACQDICPAGIAIDKLLVHSNAAAVWKFPFFWKKKS